MIKPSGFLNNINDCTSPPCRSRVQWPQETEPVSKWALHGFCFLRELLVSWLLTSASRYKNVCNLTVSPPFFFFFFLWKTFLCFPVFTLLLRDQGLNTCLPAPLLSPGLHLPSRDCMYCKKLVDVEVALNRLEIWEPPPSQNHRMFWVGSDPQGSSGPTLRWITACFSLSSCQQAGTRCGQLLI